MVITAAVHTVITALQASACVIAGMLGCNMGCPRPDNHHEQQHVYQLITCKRELNASRLTSEGHTTFLITSNVCYYSGSNDLCFALLTALNSLTEEVMFPRICLH